MLHSPICHLSEEGLSLWSKWDQKYLQWCLRYWILKILALREKGCDSCFSLFPLRSFQRENFLSHHHPKSQHRWMPWWCIFHLSNFWLISQPLYADACFRSSTQHPSLCANGLLASLRLRVQLRGDSLISHLTVLFLSSSVIIPEVDGQVRNGLYLKEPTDELIWKKGVYFLFAELGLWHDLKVHQHWKSL